MVGQCRNRDEQDRNCDTEAGKTAGKFVEIKCGKSILQGTYLGINEHGLLWLKTKDKGDVFLSSCDEFVVKEY